MVILTKIAIVLYCISVLVLIFATFKNDPPRL